MDEGGKLLVYSGVCSYKAINLEKKQLYQQWTSSLVGMRRRDEAHVAMQEAFK